jgi:hypothetical protein
MMPFLVVVGIGMAVSNTRAIIEALIGHETEFVRTPKQGDKQVKRYKVKFPWFALLEIFVGLYCAYAFTMYLNASRFGVSVFIALYAAGFIYIGLLTLAHAMSDWRLNAR